MIFAAKISLVHDGQICAIIDWDFASSYRLSELLGGVGSDLFRLEDDDNLVEHRRWSDNITHMVVEKARSRAGTRIKWRCWFE